MGVKQTQETPVAPSAPSADFLFYPVSVSGSLNPPDVVSFSQLQEQSRTNSDLHTDESKSDDLILSINDIFVTLAIVLDKKQTKTNKQHDMYRYEDHHGRES